jgi:hypothetical protein
MGKIDPEIHKNFEKQWIEMIAPWPVTIRDRRVATKNEHKNESATDETSEDERPQL